MLFVAGTADGNEFIAIICCNTSSLVLEITVFCTWSLTNKLYQKKFFPKLFQKSALLYKKNKNSRQHLSIICILSVVFQDVMNIVASRGLQQDFRLFLFFSPLRQLQGSVANFSSDGYSLAEFFPYHSEDAAWQTGVVLNMMTA